MCMVSMVMDYGMQRVPAQNWTLDTWTQYQQILALLKQLDTKLGEPECHDSAKAEWMQQVEERLAKLEHLAEIERRTRETVEQLRKEAGDAPSAH